MRYTTIIYEVKEKLGINFLEYILLDIVNIIQNAPNNGTGWSSASRAYYGRILEISDRQVRRYIEKLISKGLLERNDSHQLRTTMQWMEVAYIGAGTTSPANEEVKLFPSAEKQIREYHERKVLFRDSDVYEWDIFKTYFEGEEYRDIDIHYYYQEVKRWSESKGEKRNNWIEQTKVLMSIHAEQNKLRRIGKGDNKTEAIEFLNI